MNLKGTGVIEELTYKEGSKGWFFKLKIDGRNYNVFEKSYPAGEEVKAFAQLEAKEFKTGEAIEFEYSEHTVGETTYKNLLKLIKMEAKEAEAVVKKSTETRDKTGTQIVRMNALTNAIGFCELNKEVIAMNLKEQLNQIIEEKTVLNLAERFENWVKR